ncbi:unnamed protein product [Spirodela intermedia]|uniref:Uncharacterized protein n=1 Tax=Spirodela intermedia TaxID=51605 RepID=A0A7I8KG34_SPIIN|nr:unnamed protein product [Spirodela intermedia]
MGQRARLASGSPHFCNIFIFISCSSFISKVRLWMEVECVSRSFILRSVEQEEALHRIWYALKRWELIIDKNLINVIREALFLKLLNDSIANPSSKSSPIDRRTSRRREEDDPPGDQSPPPESVPDAMKSLLLLRGPEDEAP